jgi:hypothetical protein
MRPFIAFKGFFSFVLLFLRQANFETGRQAQNKALRNVLDSKPGSLDVPA